MNIHLHHYHHPDQATDRRLARLSQIMDAVYQRQETLMIDTSKLLAAVAEEKTESASLRALLAANTTALKDVGAQLQVLRTTGSGQISPAEAQKLQDAIDGAAAELSLDNQAAKDSLAANTTAAPPTTDAQTPPAPDAPPA